MLRGPTSDSAITGVGDVFIMAMYHPTLGDCEMNNHVVDVDYEPDRSFAWEPEAGRGHPNQHADNQRWGQRWTFTLTPDGPDRTFVTET